MSSSAVVVSLGILCGVFVVLLLLAAAFFCRRVLRRKRKLRQRDDMEKNRLLLEDILMSSQKDHQPGSAVAAETVTLLAQQEAVEFKERVLYTMEDHECISGTDTPSSSHCSVGVDVDVAPASSAPRALKRSFKRRLYSRKKNRSLSRSEEVSALPSFIVPSRPPSPASNPLRRSRSLNSIASSSAPCPLKTSPEDRSYHVQRLYVDTDSLSAFSDSVSASPSPSYSEAETVDDAQPVVNPKHRRSSRARLQLQLEYSIYYSSIESTLVVSVKRATGIPSKYGPTYASFVRVYLKPKAAGYLQTCTVRQSREPSYNDHLQFSKISLAEVWVNSLRFKLYVKGQWGGNHESVGEATRECVALIREADEVYVVTEVLQRLKHSKWRQKSLTVPDNHHITETESLKEAQLTTAPLPSPPHTPGDLLVSIQYQQIACRFKVMVRKADHLSNKGVYLLGTPPGTAHYVSLNLLRDGQAVVQSDTTRTLTGTQPTWNQPFLLHLTRQRAVADYSIEFVLMRVRFPSSGRVPVGRVVVGPQVEGTGGAHWEEVVRPRLTEVTRWHNLQPI